MLFEYESIRYRYKEGSWHLHVRVCVSSLIQLLGFYYITDEMPVPGACVLDFSSTEIVVSTPVWNMSTSFSVVHSCVG
jgi:hypothetical protein